MVEKLFCYYQKNKNAENRKWIEIKNVNKINQIAEIPERHKEAPTFPSLPFLSLVIFFCIGGEMFLSFLLKKKVAEFITCCMCKYACFLLFEPVPY